MENSDKIFQSIDRNQEKIIELQTLLTSKPALAPENDGDGEWEKASALVSWLSKNNVTRIEWFNAPDTRVSSGKRPNIVVTIPGRREAERIWIMTHLDIVPPGDTNMWHTDPYTAVLKDGRIYGRGVEDNQQGMVSSILAAHAFIETGIQPEKTVKLLFISDEEVGSEYGIKYLLREHDLFTPSDWALVPDGGHRDGSLIEIAEKSVLWLQFTVNGKQTHASRPDSGINAFTAGSALVLALDELNRTFDQKNGLFDPPNSTFSPTKKFANVPNINTIPGEDRFCIDCRILPEVSVDIVLDDIKRRCNEIEDNYRVEIDFDIKQRVESKPTSHDEPFVTRLQQVVQQMNGVAPKLIGIGGGTVGAHLRNRDVPTVVWSTLDESAHQPNEYCVVKNIVGDAKIMARLMMAD